MLSYKSTDDKNPGDVYDKAKVEFTRLFGATAGPLVKDMLVRAGTLSDAEISALAKQWRPSMTFFAAQAAAWKTARKTGIFKHADFAYNAAYESIHRTHPDWSAAGNVAAHAVLGRALSTKLKPEQVAALTAGWDEVVAPLPQSTGKVRIRRSAAPAAPSTPEAAPNVEGEATATSTND